MPASISIKRRSISADQAASMSGSETGSNVTPGDLMKSSATSVYQHEFEVYLNLARRMKLTGINQLWGG